MEERGSGGKEDKRKDRQWRGGRETRGEKKRMKERGNGGKMERREGGTKSSTHSQRPGGKVHGPRALLGPVFPLRVTPSSSAASWLLRLGRTLTTSPSLPLFTLFTAQTRRHDNHHPGLFSYSHFTLFCFIYHLIPVLLIILGFQ